MVMKMILKNFAILFFHMCVKVYLFAEENALVNMNYRLILFCFGLNLFNFLHFFFYCLPEKCKQTHVKICDPNYRKKGNKKAFPTGKQECKTSNKYKKQGYVMTKTIFTGKEIKEFSSCKFATVFASLNTKFPWFPENLFMRDRPCNTGNRNSEYKKPEKLVPNKHISVYGKLCKLAARSIQ